MVNKKYRVGYTYQHPFDATLDQECEIEISAYTEEDALAEFREVFDDRIDYCLEVN